MSNKWTKHAKEEDITNFINDNDKVIKVLAQDKTKDICEGVWVYCIDGDNENGIGILLSNIITVDIGGGRGDLVQYMTINPKEKPYIQVVINGKEN